MGTTYLLAVECTVTRRVTSEVVEGLKFNLSQPRLRLDNRCAKPGPNYLTFVLDKSYPMISQTDIMKLDASKISNCPYHACQLHRAGEPKDETLICEAIQNPSGTNYVTSLLSNAFRRLWVGAVHRV